MAAVDPLKSEVETELRKVLDKIVDELIRKNLLPKSTDKKELIDGIVKKIVNDPKISLSDLKTDLKIRKEDTYKALALSCMAASNPGNKFDFTLLFKPHDGDTQDKLKSELTKLFESILKPRLEMKKKGLTEEEQLALNKQFDALAALLLKEQFKYDPNTKLYENQKVLSTIAAFVDTESDFRRNLYGSGKPGEEPRPILFQLGDLVGVVDRAPDISGQSFMSQKDNPYTPDPMGFKIDEFFKELTNSPIDTPLENLVRAMDPHTPKLSRDSG